MGVLQREIKRPLIQKTDDNDQNWLITLSDFLTLLLVFFVMFYMMTRGGGKEKLLVQEQRPSPSGILESSGGNRIVQLSEDINQVLKRLNIDASVSAVSIDNEVVITLKERVLFKPGDAALLADSYIPLKAVAAVIRQNPDLKIEIEGHTDNVPINNRFYPSNWELSMARAISVLRYFTEFEGIDASRFAIKGNADNRPIEANDTAIQRASNRRVEIRLKA